MAIIQPGIRVRLVAVFSIGVEVPFFDLISCPSHGLIYTKGRATR